MRATQRLLALLGLAAAVPLAAAAPARFVPADPAFVVADISRVAPDPELRALMLATQGGKTRSVSEESAARLALAAAFVERAHSRREPMFVGRAESLLAPAVAGATASAAERRLYAWTLQYRHDFDSATRLLDELIATAPRDTAARSQRASVRLVRGDFTGARADCAFLVASGEAATGIPCLAEAVAGQGDLARAAALLDTAPRADDARMRAYLLTIRAELDERAGRLDAAIAGYSSALALAPLEDSIRGALVDALLARGDPTAAAEVANVERPSVALAVRQAMSARGAERARLRERADAMLGLECDRGDAAHLREAAMLEFDFGDTSGALASAVANFSRQRELPDVRILARTAVATGDAGALRTLREWLATSRFTDTVTERILAGAARG